LTRLPPLQPRRNYWLMTSRLGVWAEPSSPWRRVTPQLVEIYGPVRLTISIGMPALADTHSALRRVLQPRLGTLLLDSNVPIKEKGWLIIGLRESDSIIAADELRGLDVRVIGEQLQNEQNLGKIASFLWALDQACPEAAKKLAELLEQSWLEDRIYNERDPGRLGWFLEVLALSAPNVAARSLSTISSDWFNSTLGEATSTRDLSSLIWGLNAAD
jgi:hypothetical protein